MTTQYPDSQYALWTDPHTSFSVIYSLPVFSEIEIVCEDGFRKIPHGGLEVGGLLLGQIDKNSVHVEGYRPIECDYARGPSFILSEKDISRLRDQLAFLQSDPEAQGLRPVGWFISHARSALVMHERELALFDELFPGRSSVTILVQPKGTGAFPFSFFVRDANGQIERDGRPNAILLPTVLEGATADRDNPISSIPAPQSDVAAAPPRLPQVPAAEAASPQIVEPDIAALEPVNRFEIVAAAEDVSVYEPVTLDEPQTVIQSESVDEPLTLAEPVILVEPVPAALPTSEPGVASLPVKNEEQPTSASEKLQAGKPAMPPVETVPQEPVEPMPKDEAIHQPEVLGAAPAAAKKSKWKKYAPPPSEKAATWSEPTRAVPEVSPMPPSATLPTPQVEPAESAFAGDFPGVIGIDNAWPQNSLAARLQNARFRIAAVLIVAALLGCGIGYWAYSELPSATIPLRVEIQPPALVVMWPATQTRGSAYAALSVDNGEPKPLSEADKANGRTQLNINSDNVKIELIARHWMRDSHGIVRYINGMSRVAPPASSLSPNGAANTRYRR